MDIYEKLKILADSAKYDVSCSSSGVGRRNSGTIGSTAAAGICHSWSADGRCISLLKVVMSNACVYDCEYCVNRRTADVQRASFEPSELADLTIEFYKRNYIEGLFVSSAVEKSPDYTCEKMIKCLRILRYDKGFAGYIHAKIIPGTDETLVHRIGLLADRVSVNMELPTERSLQLLAPQKKPKEIFSPMRQITNTLIERNSLVGPGTMFKGQKLNTPENYISDMKLHGRSSLAIGEEPGGIMMLPSKRREVFAPAGQTTQMIIGASGETDRQIIRLTENLYHTFKMKRVYYSAYIPVVKSALLPEQAPQLAREHRLYQADWLLRFYGFSADELLTEKYPDLDPDLDPKISWALRNIDRFPVEINKAPLSEILRIPGVGNVSALRIVRQRKLAAVKYEDLKKMGVVLKRARYFLTCSGRYYGERNMEPEYIKDQILGIENGIQMSMFGSGLAALSGGGLNGLPV